MQPEKRHWSRRFALQAIYQWQLGGHSVDELLAQYVEDENWHKVDKDYFVDLISGSINEKNELTNVFLPFIEIQAEQIDPIENAILLFATYEITHKPETPIKVVLSEAINLCKKFGSTDGYKFVNAVLDKVAAARTSNN